MKAKKYYLVTFYHPSCSPLIPAFFQTKKELLEYLNSLVGTDIDGWYDVNEYRILVPEKTNGKVTVRYALEAEVKWPEKDK